MSVAAFAFLARQAVLDARYVVPLCIFLVSAVAIGLLAARSQREARVAARLSHEQAALRWVATLVAESARPEDIFETVPREVASVLRLDMAGLVRFEPGGIRTFLAGTGFRFGPRSGQQYDRVVSVVEPPGRSGCELYRELGVSMIYQHPERVVLVGATPRFPVDLMVVSEGRVEPKPHRAARR